MCVSSSCRAELRSPVRGRRRHGEPGHRALPLADGTRARERARAETNEYDLLEPDKLLRKYVGRDVILVRRRQENGQTREDEVKARLVSYNNAPVWQIGSEIVTGMNADHIKFPELPAKLYTHPTLIWTLDNGGAARHRIEASYLAGKLSWSSDYVLTVARDDKAADLDGWSR